MESITIEKLFDSKNRKFEIPSYQRAYSWDDKNIKQFIEDLENAETHYYLGHFLFEVKEDNILYVIDGQQRLTTCIIFFSCLKKELEKRVKERQVVSLDLEDITDYYLKDIRKGTQKFKTVRDDNNFFLEEIIESKKEHSQEVDTASKGRIREAKGIFSGVFSETTTEVLEKWCQLIEEATVTEFIVKDKVQATQVFAFQNDRGKDLTKLETIKAFFMLQIYLSGSSKEKIEENISYLEEELSKIYKQIVRINLDEDDVLNYYWRAVSGKGFNSEEVVKGIKGKIKGISENKAEWIMGFISGLAQAFQTVEKIERSTNSHIRDLRHLNNLSFAYPFFIKAYKFNASPKVVDRLAKLFENITFRYLLRGGRAEIESRLNGYLINLKPAKDYEKTFDDILNSTIDAIINDIKHSGWWWYWNDHSMREHLNSSYFYQNRIDNYLLWKYELYISDKEHPEPHKVSFEDLIQNESIEHIAPRTPTNGDPVANGYGPYKVEEALEEGIVSGNWLNSLGNLMLISRKHNSSIGNKPFDHKLESYGRDNLLNQQREIREFIVKGENPVWDKKAIEARKKKIVSAALDIWNLNRIN
ncbi:DUF262 domain-containing protein [Pontibacter sp. FD36]|uniref:DUF262 domain-containing protein n=1 Tax=Pontibacter sp. FD36 TaxID=2789860 RepID=UPI0018AA4856|nr:DUF262 domain-containing protein [Pontibacter sp. FD36]MBF8964288.1 DUF262 domain-containing protein [Pontibacter sp. FD36]